MPSSGRFTGRWPKSPDGAYHEDHEKHFGYAIQDALDTWRDQLESDQEQDLAALNVAVSLEATVSPNPGGIKEYRANITFS